MDIDCSADNFADIVLEQVRRALPGTSDMELTLDTPLDELGLDSLAIMGAFNQLEETFGLRFREEWMYDVVTCRDLAECIAAHLGKGCVPAAGKSPCAVPCEESVTDEEVPPEHYDVALFPECAAFHARLERAAAAGLDNPYFRFSQQVNRPLAVIDGREVINYTSFDYLGLAGHPRVVAAAKEAIDRFGTGASASRLVGGDNEILRTLDTEIARFLGVESAIVFPSGYGTNASLLGHLFGEDDLILYDALAHNSIMQGTLASKADRRPFPHNDVAFVDKLLDNVRDQYRRVVIAVDGLYSMDGDFPDLPRLIEVKRRHHALLYVDEAHSLGVLGATGRGLCEHFDVDPCEGDLWMGTISKALGSGGGYLAGRERLIRYLKYTTPAFVFATACSPANAAAALAALAVLREEPQRVAQLRERSALFLRRAREAGLNTGSSREAPIIPIILGDSTRCIAMSNDLLRRGVHAQPVIYPAVPESGARIRFFITSEHTEEQIARTIRIFQEALAELPGSATS